MIGNKRVIGICMTIIFNSYHCDLIDKIKKEAEKHGFGIIVYNSTLDFYNDDAYDIGAKYVYDIIDYDIVDALVVFSDNFHLPKIVDGIIENGKKAGVPVLVTDCFYEGCYCLEMDYREAYKDLMNHVIRDHGAKKTFLISGRRGDDTESQKREAIYKEVLAENGLPFTEDMIDYGGYWRNPARDCIDRLHAKSKEMPEAIFCTNDYMAIAAIERLQELGYRVPEDVKVTGFDGVPDIEFFSPRVSTCKEDMDKTVEELVRIADGAMQGKLQPGKYLRKYKMSIGNSCGCMNEAEKVFDLSKLYFLNHSMEDHETYMQGSLNNLLLCSSYSQIAAVISKYLLDNSYICLEPEFVHSLQVEENLDEPDNMLYLIWSRNNINENYEKRMHIKKLVPGIENWEQDKDSVYILTSIYVADTPCGYYAVKLSDETRVAAHMIHRISKTLNVAFTMLQNHVSRKCMQESIKQAALTNMITGLPNLKGAENWFESFCRREDVHKKPFAITIYTLTQYKYIYENYGIDEIEEVLGFIAKTLKAANQYMCYIAHINENEFLVVTYGEDTNNSYATLYTAIEEFDNSIQYYNFNSGKNYNIEVIHGTTYVDAGWQGNLASFSKMANAEMYMSRVRAENVKAHTDSVIVKDNYDTLNALIEKNLFRYCFQPIVSAATGEVYAYEALMRTNQEIGLNPLEVLQAAENYGRLYDIEKATMFNVMDQYSKHQEKFGNARIFVNHIPGYELKDCDYSQLCESYSEHMSNFVFEITEQNTISDSELSILKNMGGQKSRIAVDDYGTGHSNIVNLLRYAPHIIKIDRFLISDIDKDLNKQMFVKSTIEFARMNQIKVLAEGVETSEELKTVIGFGVDYIQGYYTGRPEFEPISCVKPEIRKEILEAGVAV